MRAREPSSAKPASLIDARVDNTSVSEDGMEVNGCDRAPHRRNYSSFGLFRDDYAEEKAPAHRKSGRFRASFGFIAIALIIITAVFFVLQVNRSSRTTKAKRFVESPPPPREDISIVPEARSHSNHKYGPEKEEGVKAGNWDVQTAGSWPKSLDNIRDIIRRIEMNDKLRQVAERPIRFKGVYLKQSQMDGPEDRTKYFREINEMLLRKDREQDPVPRRGAPFQPRTPDAADEKKPIKLMLDIYPQEISGTGSSEQVTSATGNLAYAILPIAGSRRHRVLGRSRMILKVNLYPMTNDGQTEANRRSCPPIGRRGGSELRFQDEQHPGWDRSIIM